MTTHMPFPAFPTLLPLVIIFSTFAFVLSVILIGKSPKAGACLVGGLIFVVPLLWYRAAMGGMFSTPMGLPFVIIPGTFLFILLVVLLAKAPKVGTALIVLLVGMVLFGVVFGVRAARQSTALVSQMGGVPAVVPVPLPARVIPPPSATPAPIWSAGIEKEMDADVYPSKLAAVRALGTRIDKSLRELIGDVNVPPRVTIFQEESDQSLILGLKNALQQVLPQATCAVEAEMRNLQPKEIGVTVRMADMDFRPAPWASSAEIKVANGKMQASVFSTEGRIVTQRQFMEKPWADNFAAFASGMPGQAFIIARSLGTCTSESEAYQQALEDARVRVTEALGAHAARTLGPSAPPITTTDVVQGVFIMDRFAQSFEGSAGKIWRQALLIDLSGPRLARLAQQKAREFRQVKMTWARMGFSAVGVVILIGVIYFFLNMATMGYYEWSLRIAGAVLALVGVLSILMVVK